MKIEGLIPSSIYLAPLSRFLPVSEIEAIDFEGNITPKAGGGYAWLVTENDITGTNHEFVSLEKLWHKPSEEPKPIKDGMLSVGCLVRYKSGVFEYNEYWFGEGYNKWVDPVLSSFDIDVERIHSWCYIKDLLPKGGE